ncbi:DUF882 domain-containing protein [Rhodoplanes sp. Z2-YC6860]|uniref:DUF882 domain-containing protein n=1 Tax=Rhodoplanes sp. Z2-YC6860 TaxID=674703 RepID=UPI001F379441|nr:DUF882 domain-containing protein [Rhodoplanes sp. Z2-YC6860]
MRRAGLATFCVLAGSAAFQQAGAVNPDDTRTISLHHVHTNEDLTITFKRNGQYDEAALQKINWILRDWRKNQAIAMDPHEIDLLWEVYRDVGAKGPIHIICGYRSPETNSMLRSRSKGVAKFSQHTLGKAIDFYIPGIPLDVLRATAMKVQGGGVGYYPTSGSPFVHVDVGNVRAWPRMTREQLVKLFPDGRTVHLPADGKPLPGYQLALADVERGQRSVAKPEKRNFLARLFSRDKDAEEADDNASAASEPSPAPAPAARSVVAAAKPAPSAQAAAPARTMVLASAATPEPVAVAAETTVQVPMPPRRPIYQVATADALPPAPAPRPAAPINLASLSPNDIIGMRGLWDAQPQPADTQASDSNLSSARRTLAASLSGNRDLTAGINSFASSSDRVPVETALAYAAPDAGTNSRPRAVVSTNGSSSSVAEKPANFTANRVARTADRLDDPWLRGVILAPSVQSSLVVMRVGELDVTSLTQHMQKPASSVVMTFNADPNAGMTTDSFTGSAVVFQTTVIFNSNSRRTAALR